MDNWVAEVHKWPCDSSRVLPGILTPCRIGLVTTFRSFTGSLFATPTAAQRFNGHTSHAQMDRPHRSNASLEKEMGGDPIGMIERLV